MRLIDADAFEVFTYTYKNNDFDNGVQYVLEAIDNAPTIGPKKGKWIRENIVLTSNPPQYKWHCSECGKMVHWFTAEVLTDFCPNCGADMRGEQP